MGTRSNIPNKMVLVKEYDNFLHHEEVTYQPEPTGSQNRAYFHLKALYELL